MTKECQTLFGPIPNGSFDVTMTDITATEIHEPAGTMAPTTILHINEAFTIDIQWDVSGTFWARIGGQWHLHAYLEHMGAGADLDLTDPQDHLIPFRYANDVTLPAAPPVHYHVTFDVPANTVTHRGAYKLVVTLTYRDMLDQPDDMAGYWEGPILQFYP